MTFRSAPPVLGEGFAPALELLAGGDRAAELLQGSGRGVEREALRMDAQGRIARTLHPQELGSPLCHPGITTDYAEAQLELVTGAHADIPRLMGELRDVHAFVDETLAQRGEWLWPLSMPPPDGDGDGGAAIARYGGSHAGRAKELYRAGLKRRYGASVQAISGVHYNLSLGDALWRMRLELGLEEGLAPGADAREARDRGYMAMARNFLRWHWLLVWCAGASPLSFAPAAPGTGCAPSLDCAPDGNRTDTSDPAAAFAEDCCPQAGHSLRNGPCGYCWECQPDMRLGYRDLAGHVDDLEEHLLRTRPQWLEGWDSDDPGHLRPTLLQIPNELYAPIRLKQEGDDLVAALREKGVGWVEIRCVDASPFAPCGLDAATARLVEMVLLWCALTPSPDFGPLQLGAAQRNLRKAALEGRGNPVMEMADGTETDLATAVAALADQLGPLARMLGPAWEEALAALGDWGRTPSGRLCAMQESAGGDALAVARQLAEGNRAELRAYTDSAPVAEVLFAVCRGEAEASLEEARGLEAADSGSFGEYLAAHYPFRRP